MTKPRARIVYRDRPTKNYLSLDTIKRIKDWFYSVGAIAVVLWAFAGPFVQAQAAEYLKAQLTLIGMDPATVQALNKNLTDLQEAVKETAKMNDDISGEVGDLKVELGKVLELLRLQAQQQNAPVEPVK